MKQYTRKNRAKLQVEQGKKLCPKNLKMGTPKSHDIYEVLSSAKSRKKSPDMEKEPKEPLAEELKKQSRSAGATPKSSSSASTPTSPSRPFLLPPSSSALGTTLRAKEASLDAKIDRSKKEREEASRARQQARVGSPTKTSPSSSPSRSYQLGSVSALPYRSSSAARETSIKDYFPERYYRWATDSGDHHYSLDRHLKQLEELDRAGRTDKSDSLGLVNRSWATSPTSSSLSFRPAYKREGLQNLGNTCYMNAVLQSLLSLETFVSDMNRDEFIQALPYTSFYQALLQIAVEMRREKHGIINPWPVKDAVARMAKQFSDWTQQDAHEFLVSCLDQLEGEIEKLDATKNEGADDRNGKDAENKKDEESERKRKNERCPVFLNFESEVEHTFTCRDPDCENVARKPEIFRDFSLEIIKPPPSAEGESKPSVQDLVKFWFHGNEVVEMRCGKCEVAGEADVGHSFLRLPRVLILHLKRFKPQESDLFTIDKLRDLVRISKTLDLAFCCDRRTYNPHTPGPLNLPSHDEAFVSTPSRSSPSPTLSSSSSSSSSSSPHLPSVRSSEFKVPAPPSSKVVIPPHSSFPAVGHRRKADQDDHDYDDDVASVIEGDSVLKRHRTGGVSGQAAAGPKPSSERSGTSSEAVGGRTVTAGLSEEEMMERALKESEMSFAQETRRVEQANAEEERIRKEQEELDMAIALSLEEDQEDQRRTSVKRKRSEAAETTSSTSASPLRMSRIFADDYDPDEDEWREPQDKCSTLYHLRSIVVHWGDKASMGHYTSYVLDPTSSSQSQWKEYNDDKVFELKESEALGEKAEKNGYLLFYVHDSVQGPRAQHQQTTTTTARMEEEKEEKDREGEDRSTGKRGRKGGEKRDKGREDEDDDVAWHLVDRVEKKKKNSATTASATTGRPYDKIAAANLVEAGRGLLPETDNDILELDIFSEPNSATASAGGKDLGKGKEEKREKKKKANARVNYVDDEKPTGSGGGGDEAGTGAAKARTKPPRMEEGRKGGNREEGSGGDGAGKNEDEDEDEEFKRAIELSLAEANKKEVPDETNGRRKPTEATEARHRGAAQTGRRQDVTTEADEEEAPEESRLEDKRKRRKLSRKNTNQEESTARRSPTDR